MDSSVKAVYLLIKTLLCACVVEAARYYRSYRSYSSYSRYYSRYYSYYSYYYYNYYYYNSYYGYSSSGSAGIIAGAVVGSIVGLVIIITIIVIIRHRIKNRPRQPLVLTTTPKKTTVSIVKTQPTVLPAKQTIPPPHNNFNYSPNLHPPAYASQNPAYPPPAFSYGYNN